MRTLLCNKVAVPIKSDKLVDASGIWYREVLPDIWLMDISDQPICISGIGYGIVQNGQFGKVVEACLKKETDIQFGSLDLSVKKSLDTFFEEYKMLRSNGMDGLLRAAQKEGIQFCFYHQIPEDKNRKMRACFSAARHRISFCIPAYQSVLQSCTLAHELGHFILSDDIFMASTPEKTVCCSDICLKWMSLNRMYQCMLDSKRWGMAYKQYYEKRGKDHRFVQPYYHFVSQELALLFQCSLYNQSNPKDQKMTYQEEMICRILGWGGSGQENWKYPVHHRGVELIPIYMIVKLAEAKANGSCLLYQSILNEIHNYTVSSDTTEKMMAFWRAYAQTPKRNSQLKELKKMSLLLLNFKRSLIQESNHLIFKINRLCMDNKVHCFKQKKVQKLIKRCDHNLLQYLFERRKQSELVLV